MSSFWVGLIGLVIGLAVAAIALWQVKRVRIAAQEEIAAARKAAEDGLRSWVREITQRDKQ